MEKSIKEQVLEIVDKGFYTFDDIEQLERLKFHMSLEYERLNNQWTQMEVDYNQWRSSKYIELYEKTKKDWFSKESAKDYAENRYWHYRVMNSEAQWLAKVIKAIEWVILTFHARNKHDHNTEYSANANKDLFQ